MPLKKSKNWIEAEKESKPIALKESAITPMLTLVQFRLQNENESIYLSIFLYMWRDIWTNLDRNNTITLPHANKLWKAKHWQKKTTELDAIISNKTYIIILLR
jgi:hypothetical protein